MPPCRDELFERTIVKKPACTWSPQEHSYVIWLKISGFTNTPTMIRCTVGCRMHRKPSARKVTYSSPRRVDLGIPIWSWSRLGSSCPFTDVVSNGKDYAFECSPSLISLKVRWLNWSWGCSTGGTVSQNELMHLLVHYNKWALNGHFESCTHSL